MSFREAREKMRLWRDRIGLRGCDLDPRWSRGFATSLAAAQSSFSDPPRPEICIKTSIHITWLSLDCAGRDSANELE